ncbi:MAG TPA: formyl-CoA transferase, partial [Dehalococcoidia bacterium]|nr:formyl-CoA transferase [Dehalococcoidia bacterium]
MPISAYLGSGHVVQREGNGKGLGGTYQTKDGWIIIAANNDAMWGRMCEAVNKPEWLEDTRFSTRADRQANNDALEDELTEWFSERNTRDAA